MRGAGVYPGAGDGGLVAPRLVAGLLLKVLDLWFRV